MADEEKLQISREMAEIINNAAVDGFPMAVAYVDAAGRPHLSYRGSTQVLSEDQLGIWARNPSGGLPQAIGDNPHIALMLRNQTAGATFIFTGRAHLDASPSLREHIYDNMPEREQQDDPERKGHAIVVDLDQIEGRWTEGRFKMVRG